MGSSADMLDRPEFIICGGCHIDRQLRLTAPPQPGRTNPAQLSERLGGVATNIAVQLAHQGAAVRLVGVQPADSLVAIQTRLAAAGIEPWLAPLDGDPPSYTAFLAPDGELIMGAATMDIYDTVSLSLIHSGIEAPMVPVILDANFPADTISDIAAECAGKRPLLAAGTSVAKVTRLTAALCYLDALVLNRDEAATLVGQMMPVDAMARMIAARLSGGGVVLVSDGADMAALADQQMVVTARPPRIGLVNANGAGDVMAARLFSDLVRQSGAAPTDLLQAALAAGAAYAAALEVKL